MERSPMKRRFPPIPVCLVSALFILAGAAGLLYHIGEWPSQGAGLFEAIWVLTVRLIAVICGLLLLYGFNAARWLAIAWLAYHVALSTLHGLTETITHLVLLILVAGLLYLPASRNFFMKNGR